MGDALRAVSVLGVEDADEVRAVCALILGAPAPRRAPREVQAARAIPAPVSPMHPAPAPVQETKKEIPTGDRFDVPSQLIELEPRPADHERAKSPKALALAAVTEWRATPRPLFRAPVERSILREIAATELPSATIDVDRLVESLVRIELPRELPFLSESTTRRGVQLLVDRCARLDGFAADVARIEERFVSLLSRGSVETLRFREAPSIAGAGSSDTWTPYRSPGPFVPIVVVTAFSRLSERVWELFARRWAREQRAVTFLVPHDAGRAPPAVAATARVVVWDAPTTAGSVRRRIAPRPAIEPEPEPSEDSLDRLARRNPDAAKLARYASLAAHVEPALLRALRDALLPGGVTPAVELDLWTSDVTTSNTREGFVFAAHFLDRLRREVAGDARLSEALSIVKRLHLDAPPLLRLEESLIALSLGAAPPGDARSIESEIETVVAAMEQSSARARNLSHWYARTVARLPRAIVDSEGGRLMSFIAGSFVPGAAATKALPSDAALKRAAAIVPRGRKVRVAIRWQGPEERRQLELQRVDDAVPVDERWHVLHVESCDPLVVWVGDEPIAIGTEPVHVDVSRAARSTPIRDLAGCSWEVVPRDDHAQAIAVVRAGHQRCNAFLVDADLCLISRHAINAAAVELDFPWGTVHGRILWSSRRGAPRDEPFGDSAMIRLEKAVTPAPLVLGPDANPADEWELAAGASTRLRGRGFGRGADDELPRLLQALPFSDPKKYEKSWEHRCSSRAASSATWGARTSRRGLAYVLRAPCEQTGPR